MNILHISSDDDKYGSALCLKELILQEKKQNDIVPTVVTPVRTGINDFCDENHINNYVVTFSPLFISTDGSNVIRALLKKWYRTYRYHYKRGKSVNDIVEICKKNNIDVIHTNNITNDIGAHVAKKCCLPHVWHIRECGHNMKPIVTNAIKKMNQKTDCFICVSNVVANAWKNMGLESSKLKVIYDGVDGELFSSNQIHQANQIKKIISVGYFDENKGQKQIIRAISLLSNDERKKIEVYFYGEQKGNYYLETYNLTKKNDLDNIHFMGYKDNISEEFYKYDVGILCSKSEGLPRTLIEYMMSGLNPIVSDADSNIEAINGKYGFIFEHNNAEQLAGILRDIIYNRYDNILIEEMKAFAYKNYDINKNSKRIFNQIKEYCNN